MPPARRAWSRGEEIANSVSHTAGFLAAVAGAPFLISQALRHGGAGSVIGAVVFIVTAMLLYFSSAAHHWLPAGPGKDTFEVVDHAAIFLMIAGSYTPFALGVLWGWWGVLLLSVIWPLALVGVALKAVRGIRRSWLTVALYVAMGWFMVVALRPLLERASVDCVWFLLAGGIAYTGGLVFYSVRSVPYHHLAWHLAVLAGTAFHYFAVLRSWR